MAAEEPGRPSSRPRPSGEPSSRPKPSADPARTARPAKPSSDRGDESRPRSTRPSETKPPSKSAEEKEWERWEQVVISGVGFLSPLILTFANLLAIPPISTAIILATIFMALLTRLPPPYVPYAASVITFLIPFSNTYNLLSPAIHASGGLPSGVIQWIFYWMVYVLLEGIKGLVGIYRPGWRWWFELWRLVWLVVLGGPWFAKERIKTTSDPKPPKPAPPSGNAPRTETSEERLKRKAKEASDAKRRAA